MALCLPVGMRTLPAGLDTRLEVGWWGQHCLLSCPEDMKGLAVASGGPGKAMPSERADSAEPGAARRCGAGDRCRRG